MKRALKYAAVAAVTAVAVAGGVVAQTSETGLEFVVMTPCRLTDTRAGSGIGPRQTPLGPDDTYTLSAVGQNGQCAIPSTAKALSTNVTFVRPTAASYATVYPADVARPNTSSLNWSAGQAPGANAVTVKLSADGRVSVYNSLGTVDMIVDVVGYYVAGAATSQLPADTQRLAAAEARIASLENQSPGAGTIQKTSRIDQVIQLDTSGAPTFVASVYFIAPTVGQITTIVSGSVFGGTGSPNPVRCAIIDYPRKEPISSVGEFYASAEHEGRSSLSWAKTYEVFAKDSGRFPEVNFEDIPFEVWCQSDPGQRQSVFGAFVSVIFTPGAS